MRPLILATLTLVTALGAGQADAQRYRGGGSGPGASYPVPGNTMPAPPAPSPQGQMPQAQMQRPPMSAPGHPYPGPRPANQPDRHRWGGSVGGRWQGGLNAPGGWNAYRRPSRGYRIPGYWNSPSFFLGDYAGYGLSVPPAGYGWYRYYDDAVLLDPRGRVYDSVDGLDWDGGYDDRGYGPGGYDQAGGYGRPYPAPLPPIVQNGNVTTYSTTAGYGGGYGYAYPGATTTVVTIQSAPVVTTTTTEYVETVRERQVYRAAPRKRYYRPVRRKPVCRPVEQPILGS